MATDLQLAVVIPVYNEHATLTSLVNDWQETFRAALVDYLMIFVDDGSSDDSRNLLEEMQLADGRLKVYGQQNAGHGSAILHGYKRALATGATWIFQIDSDHQLDTAAFGVLWDQRETADLLLGQRALMHANAGRRNISTISKLIVRLFFGPGVSDVNCPYRLMRASDLAKAIGKIPATSFAPNVLITSWFIRQKKKILTTICHLRVGDEVRPSKMSWYMLRGSAKAAFHTILFRIRS